MVFISDKRRNPFESGKWQAYYAKPSPLANYLSRIYPLGSRIVCIRVIEWDSGQLLTIIGNRSHDDTFTFDFWAGLTPAPEV